MEKKKSIYQRAAEWGVPFGLYLACAAMPYIFSDYFPPLSFLFIIMVLGIPFIVGYFQRHKFIEDDGFTEYAGLWMLGIMLFLLGTLVASLIVYLVLQYFRPTFMYDQAQVIINAYKDMPEMKRLYAQYDIQGVEFIGVTFDTVGDVLQEYMDKEQLPWRVIGELEKMKDSKMAKDYHIQWIPTMYLLDTEGRVLLATVEIEKLKAKLAELKKANKLVAPELAGQDHAPYYPGGTTALMKFLSTHIKYPADAERCGVEGRVMVTFYVEPDGKVSDVKVAKTDLKNRLSDKKFDKYSDIDKFAMREKGEGQLKEEALRVVSMMVDWKPAQRRGKPARVKYSLPVTFRLK